MVIGYIISRIRTGGALTLVRKHIAHIRAYHPHVTVRVCALLPSAENDAVARGAIREWEAKDVSVTVLNHKGARDMVGTVQALVEEMGQVDIVHALHSVPLTYVLLASKITRKPLVIEWIGDPWIGGLSSKRRKYANLIALKFAAANIVLSHTVKGMMPTDRDVYVVYPPFDIDVHQDRESESNIAGLIKGRYPVVLIVSRMAALKGIRHIPAVIREVVSRFPDALFLLAGDGPDRPSLEIQIEAMGLQGAVQILGFRNDVPFLYEHADLYISTSESEGLVGYATLEAIMSGVPVVASDIPSVRELLRDGIDAFLVCPGDEEGYGAAVTKMLENEDARTQMSLSARLQVQSALDPRVTAQALIDVYAEVVA